MIILRLPRSLEIKNNSFGKSKINLKHFFLHFVRSVLCLQMMHNMRVEKNNQLGYENIKLSFPNMPMMHLALLFCVPINYYFHSLQIFLSLKENRFCGWKWVKVHNFLRYVVIGLCWKLFAAVISKTIRSISFKNYADKWYLILTQNISINNTSFKHIAFKAKEYRNYVAIARYIEEI